MIKLRVLSETATTITLGWDSIPGLAGYRFFSSAMQKPSHTWDGARTSARMPKSDWYTVEPLSVDEIAAWPTTTEPPAPPPVPQPGKSIYLNDLGEFGRLAKPWDDPASWHQDSAKFVSVLVGSVQQMPLALAAYGVVCVQAKQSDPTITVVDSRGWGTLPKGTHGPFRCPAWSTGANGTDGHIAIIQPNGSVLDMWRGRRTSSTKFSSEATCLFQPGQWNAPQASCRGSSFSLLSGCVASEEIKNGIAHALIAVISASIIRKGPVPPSNGSDGEQATGIPEGARFVAPPNVPAPSNATALEKQAWRALQRHGMIIGDRTSGPELSFLAIDPVSFTGAGQPDPWKAQGLTGYPQMTNLIPLLKHLRVERW